MSHIADYIIPLFKKPGTFLEIGCWKGDHISQTAELESLGWSGICIDPFPSSFEYRKCRLVAKAISADGLPRKFIKVSIDRRHGGDVSYFSGFKDRIAFHWPLIREHCDFEELFIDTITFDQVEAPGHIQFLSVDVEGAELEIFRSIKFWLYEFDVIMYEHNGVNNGVANLLQANGYKLYKRLELDDIFINSKYDAQTMVG